MLGRPPPARSLRRRSQPSKRDGREQFLLGKCSLGDGHALVHLGAHRCFRRSRAQTVHANPTLLQVTGPAARERSNGSLGRTVAAVAPTAWPGAERSGPALLIESD